MSIKKYGIVCAMLSSMICLAMEMPQSMKQSKLLRDTLAGAGAGCIEVGLVGHICSYLVNQTILNNKFSVNPKHWSMKGYVSLLPQHMYSGVGVNLVSMAPITALQNVLTENFAILYASTKGCALSDIEKLAPPAIAGAIAAVVVATPAERIPNYMQKVITEKGIKLSPWQATKKLIKDHGISTPWRGVTATALRDGLFTIGYKTLPQLMTHYMKPLSGDNEATVMGASIVSGVVTAVATQPMQVIARYMQNNSSIATSVNALTEVYKSDGLKGLWKGGVPRGMRVMVAIPVLSYSEKKISSLIENRTI